MAAQKGLDFVLKVGDGATVEAFTNIGGFRSNSLSINNESVDVTSKTSAGNRALLDGAGVSSFEVSGSGVFEDDTQFGVAEGHARADTQANYQIVIPGFGTYEGAFQITSLEFGGEHNGEVTYSISLASSGAISFTAA